MQHIIHVLLKTLKLAPSINFFFFFGIFSGACNWVLRCNLIQIFISKIQVRISKKNERLKKEKKKIEQLIPCKTKVRYKELGSIYI